MSTTIDLFAEQPREVVLGEPAGDVSTIEPRVGPAEAASPAAWGNESSVEQAVTVRGAEAGIATLPADAGCSCGGCGEWTKTITGFGHCEHLPVWTTMSPRAACHFNPSRWVTISAETKSRREAQAAIDRAADEAESNVHGWSDRALDFVKEFSESNRGRRFIGREIVVSLKTTTLPIPPSDHAYGAVIQRAVKAGVLRKVGDSQGADRPVPEYESA